MIRRTLVVTTVLISCAVITTAAQAHAKLTSTNPAASAVVAESPKDLRLIFNEGLIAKFSGIELKTEKGEKIETGTAVADPIDNKQLIVPLPAALADGVYSIKWHAVSEDTHKLEGTYSFTVKH
ncbi:copper homeostasis periplasmic binding protein CopC [Hyphomicrobium sp. 2TAF46]|uniref:copper homeostasis periplasmic binding protein CopC n=1 Tax=Hyphomicrobium sp. 2TAF46 TaxID=3233019 RepID=UPI003F928D74